MKLSQFNFNLTKDKIASEPPRWRDECRLMVLNRKTGEIEHKLFKDLIQYFRKDDTFVLTDTKVFPARLYGNKEKTGADIEVFLLRELNKEQRLWDVIVDPARKIRIGNKLYFGEDESLVAEVITIRPPAAVPSASSSTVPTRNSRKRSSPSARRPSCLGSRRRSPRKTGRISRRSSPCMKEPSPPRRPACTSAANSSTE